MKPNVEEVLQGVGSQFFFQDPGEEEEQPDPFIPPVKRNKKKGGGGGRGSGGMKGHIVTIQQVRNALNLSELILAVFVWLGTLSGTGLAIYKIVPKFGLEQGTKAVAITVVWTFAIQGLLSFYQWVWGANMDKKEYLIKYLLLVGISTGLTFFGYRFVFDFFQPDTQVEKWIIGAVLLCVAVLCDIYPERKLIRR